MIGLRNPHIQGLRRNWSIKEIQSSLITKSISSFKKQSISEGLLWLGCRMRLHVGKLDGGWVTPVIIGKLKNPNYLKSSIPAELPDITHYCIKLNCTAQNLSGHYDSMAEAWSISLGK